MQKFIGTVSSALKALLKGPAWLLWTLFSIFKSKSRPPPVPSLGLSSLSDSPYENAHSYPPRPAAEHRQSPSAHHPPPAHQSPATHRSPAAHQTPSAHQPPSAHRSPSTHQPPSTHQSPSAHQPPFSHQPSSFHQSPSAHQPPFSHQPSSFYQSPSAHQPPFSHQPSSFHQSPSAHQPPPPHQPRRQPSVRFPAQPTPLVSPDVAPVNEPVRSHIPQRSRRPSGPDLPTRTPEIVVTPVEIDPYEDADSLRRKARIEGGRMEKCFKQSQEAYNDKNGGRAKELSSRGEAYKDNMVRLDKAASTKIFEGMRVGGQTVQNSPTYLQLHLENNQGLGFDTIDLHGLFVSEAKLYFDNAVQKVRNHEESSLRVIVGKGNHSENNIPKIKVAIQERARSLGLGVEVDPLNEGCLVVSL
ncbi:uncharacterized protein HD556DRAFT_699881 [Suillus plorans]|uniref:Smr domain-containing protein n=1 Tax=Suillus plorans TaxID=116603 RepID=A0A9P7DTG8_9AGAM|nr:uncharacterized protein HD556DRAFT_699881 [Suillus plorans]KAG1802623.1 hypothetical protein HD556DRAFT_699881 [Suillus plorans]